MDHRCGTRFTLSMAVVLQLPDQQDTAGRLVVGSVTGALVETRASLPPLSPVLLRPLGAMDPESAIEAYVVRTTDKGMALEWLDPACDAVLALLPVRVAPASSAMMASAARSSIAQDSL